MIALAAALLAVASDCGAATTTADISACAAKAYARADAEMTAAWRAALGRMKRRDAAPGAARLPGPGYAAALLDAQRRWLAFRDAQCRIEGYRVRGGSAQGYSTTMCLTELTHTRTRQLHDLASEGQ